MRARAKPADGLAFDASVLSRRDEVLKKAFVQLKAQQAELDAKNGELTKLLTDKQNLDDELKTAARRGRRRAQGRRSAAGHAQLQRGRDPRPLYRPAAARGRLGARQARRSSSSASRACRTTRASASSITCCGARTASRWGWSRPSAPARMRAQGQQQAKLYADCLEARFGQRPVIFYSNGYEHWIWDDTRYPPRQIGGFYKRDELELADPAPHRPEEAGFGSDQPQDRRAPLSAPRDPQRRAEFRAGRRAQGAAGDGDRLRQDAHGDRAGRSPDARRLGEARAVPRRPGGAGEPGGRRLQGASAGRRAGQSRHRAHQRRPRVSLDLSDDDEPDRRQAGGQGEVRPRPFRPDRHRRGASLGLSALPRHLRIFRLASSSA